MLALEFAISNLKDTEKLTMIKVIEKLRNFTKSLGRTPRSSLHLMDIIMKTFSPDKTE